MVPVLAGLELGKSFIDLMGLLVKRSPDFPQKKKKEFQKRIDSYIENKYKTKEYAMTDFHPDVLMGMIKDLKKDKEKLDRFCSTWNNELSHFRDD